MDIIFPKLQFQRPLISLDLNKLRFITLHHIDHENATAEDIHRWHLNNGWSGNGYNEYIRKDGKVYICRGDNIGAHSHKNNSSSYGIACEGDYDNLKRQIDQMPRAQFDSLVVRIKYHIGRIPNSVEVVRHSTQNNTSCPGKHFPFDKVLQAVNNNHWGEAIVSLKKRFPEAEIKDIEKISDYALESILKYYDKKIIQGDENGNFNPKNYITRQDLIVILDRFEKYLRAD